MLNRLLILAASLLTAILPAYASFIFNVGDFKYETLEYACVRVIGAKFNTDEYTIPSTVTYSGKDYTVTEIGPEAFSEKSLKRISLPESLTVICDRAFNACYSLKQINLPENLTEIGAGAFGRCSSLEQISLLGSLTKIGESAFYGCKSLKQISLPGSLTEIGVGAFKKCSSLEQISLPRSLTVIGDETFYECSSLEQISLPGSLTKIGKSAFYGCGSLEQISLPGSLTEIGKFAFEECTSLEQINLPGSLTKIGVAAFAGCTSLSQIDWNDRLRVIPSSAFLNCAALTSVELPATTEMIGEKAFYGCISIQKVISYSENPPASNIDFFDNETYTSACLYVPANSIGRYRDDNGWGRFQNVESIESGIDNICSADTDIKTAVLDGRIVFTDGYAGMVEIFDMDGTLLYQGAGDNMPRLGNGSYIVRRNNQSIKLAI